MNHKNLFLIIMTLSLLLLVYGCTTPAPAPQPEPEPEPAPEPEPEEEEVPEVVEEPEEEEIELSDELVELLTQAENRVQNVKYKYLDSSTTDQLVYTFYIRDNYIKMVIDPPRNDIRLDEDAYDVVHFDTEAQTAEGYCEHRQCLVKGKKADLVYDDVYIWTPFDYLEQATVTEKLGEELIAKRNAARLQTEDFGEMFVDQYYGFPVRIEYSEDVYIDFYELDFNGLEDEDFERVEG